VDASVGQLTLYRDGNKDGQMAFATTGLADSTDSLLVGATLGHTGDWAYLKGFVDEVRISDVARYSGDTPGVPQQPFTCDEHIRALWHFDEFEGTTTFRDKCGVNNSLVGYNGAHTEGVPVHKAYLPLVLRWF
jgi:hypothetical protein